MREVEHRVGGVQVGPAPRPVGETGDLDGAKDRGERPVVARLYCPVADTMGIGDLFQGDLSHGAQVKVVLQQLTFELAPMVRSAVSSSSSASAQASSPRKNPTSAR